MTVAAHTACCFLLALLLQLWGSAVSLKFAPVDVIRREGHDVSCEHTAARNVQPVCLQLWWYNNGQMTKIASVDNRGTWQEPSFRNITVTGFQLQILSVLSVTVKGATADELGSYICTMIYTDGNGQEKSGVVDYANYVQMPRS